MLIRYDFENELFVDTENFGKEVYDQFKIFISRKTYYRPENTVGSFF